MKTFTLLLVNLIVSSSFAQLNCKEIKLFDNSFQTKCFHQNGKVSVLETWDKDHRWGNIHAYNSEGKELFFHDLRTVGGRASVKLNYFPNGQVSEVYYSDAPDGGIQYYNSTTNFDEKGNQTGFSETKYPFEPKDLIEQPVVPENQSKEEVKKEELKPEEAPKQEVVQCAPVYSTFYELQNATGKKLKIRINALPNNTVSTTGKEIVLGPNQTLVFDTIYMAGIFVTDKIYQPELLIETRKTKRIKVVEPGPLTSGPNRTVYWYFTEEYLGSEF